MCLSFFYCVLSSIGGSTTPEHMIFATCMLLSCCTRYLSNGHHTHYVSHYLHAGGGGSWLPCDCPLEQKKREHSPGPTEHGRIEPPATSQDKLRCGSVKSLDYATEARGVTSIDSGKF